MLTLVQEVEKHFLDKILSEELQPGDRLPTVQEIRKLLSVGHVTASRALQGLSKKGYVESVRGRGSFVCDPLPAVPPKPTPVLQVTYAFGHRASGERTSLYMWAYQGAKSACESAGHRVEFVAVDFANPEDCAPPESDLSAIILDSHQIIAQCEWADGRSRKTPLVYCGLGQGPSGPNSVTPDNYAGARLAANYLLENGHRRITFVGVLSDVEDYRCRERLRGLENALSEAGLSPATVVRWHVDRHSEDVIARLKGIKAGKRDMPTALFVDNDAMAAEIMRAAALLGVRIPDELSVIGFENHDIDIQPALTTVGCDMAELGRKAVRLAEEILERPQCQPIHVRLPMRLVERSSVRNLNESRNAREGSQT